jgi:hypothetical protein
MGIDSTHRTHDAAAYAPTLYVHGRIADGDRRFHTHGLDGTLEERLPPEQLNPVPEQK